MFILPTIVCRTISLARDHAHFGVKFRNTVRNNRMLP